MGHEAPCTLRIGKDLARGKALLESDSLIFRGDLRITIPFKEMRSVQADGGRLTIASPQGIVVFEVGDVASQWAERIRTPRSLIDKLGVTMGSRVALLGIGEAAFLAQVRERAGEVLEGEAGTDLDFVFLAAAIPKDLARLREIARGLRENGAIWVVWPKGRQEIKEDHVRAAGRKAGLVDVKVVAFSTTHSALKLVIPLKRRPSRARARRGA